MTSEFVPASGRTPVQPFRLIEHKGLLARLGEELSRAATELAQDPRGFLRGLVSSADTKDQKRRRLILFGLASALVLHAALLIVMVIAGWHRILEGPKEQTSQDLVVKSWVPTSKPGPENVTEDRPRGELDKGGGAGGQQDDRPASKAAVLPQMAPLPPITPVNPSTDHDPLLAVKPTVQGPEGPPPPPGLVGDPNGKPGPASGGPGTGGGVGNKDGSGVGSGDDGPGAGPGKHGGTGGGEGGDIEGKGTNIGSLYFNAPKPEGFVPFRWLYRPTPVVTPEAQANKVGGTVLLMASFRADGTITDIEIKNQVDFMTESVIDALKRSKFRPATINGVPITLFRVPVRVNIEVTAHP